MTSPKRPQSEPPTADTEVRAADTAAGSFAERGEGHVTAREDGGRHGPNLCAPERRGRAELGAAFWSLWAPVSGASARCVQVSGARGAGPTCISAGQVEMPGGAGFPGLLPSRVGSLRF